MLIHNILQYMNTTAKSGKSLTAGPYFTYTFLKILPVGDGSVLHLSTIIIDSIHRVPQKRSDVGGLGNSELDERKDT